MHAMYLTRPIQFQSVGYSIDVMHEVVRRSMDEVLIFKPPNVDLPPDSSKSPKFAPSNYRT